MSLSIEKNEMERDEMAEIQVVFLQEPVVGKPLKFISSGREGYSSPVIEVTPDGANPAFLHVFTHSGTHYVGACHIGTLPSPAIGKLESVDSKRNRNSDAAGDKPNLLCSCGESVQPGFRFCPSCGMSRQMDVTCGECGRVNASSNAFCVGCGASLLPAKRMVTYVARPAVVLRAPPPPASHGITMEFGHSTSSRLSSVLRTAMEHQSFVQYGAGKTAKYRVTFTEAEIESAAALAHAVSGWQSSLLYFCGKETSWDSVFGFRWCFSHRDDSYSPTKYCFGYDDDSLNLWGCMRADLPFSETADWFSWGRFVTDDGDWEPDKERIAFTIRRNLHSYRYCPALQMDRVNAVLNILPARVNPNKDEGWEFVRCYSESKQAGAERFIRVDQYTVLAGVYPNRAYIDHLASRLGLDLKGL